MKKIISLIALSFCIAIIANAQIKPNGKAVIKVPALTCEPCKDKIEQYLFKAYGITSVKANFRNQTVTVTWLTDRTTIEEIRAHINNNGFDADDEKAEENAAKKVPACCVPKPVIKPIVVAPIETKVVTAPAAVKQVADTVKKKITKTASSSKTKK